MELTEMQISLLDDGDPYAPPDSNPGLTEPRQLSAATHVFAPRPGHRLMIRAGLRQAPEAVTYFNRFVLEHDEVRARYAHAAHMRMHMPRTCACRAHAHAHAHAADVPPAAHVSCIVLQHDAVLKKKPTRSYTPTPNPTPTPTPTPNPDP